jgi:hypothetical protein
MTNQRVVDFAINRIQGPASKLPHDGFERPSHCQFGPDGALYVVDFGIIKLALESGGIRMQKGSGSLWRIRRTDGPHGDVPPKSVSIPLYGIQAGLILGGLFVGIAGLSLLLRRLTKIR